MKKKKGRKKNKRTFAFPLIREDPLSRIREEKRKRKKGGGEVKPLHIWNALKGGGNRYFSYDSMLLPWERGKENGGVIYKREIILSPFPSLRTTLPLRETQGERGGGERGGKKEGSPLVSLFPFHPFPYLSW